MSKIQPGMALLFGALASQGKIKPAKNGSDYKLILNGVEEIKWFTDRPDRLEGEWKPQKLINKWDTYFETSEPNAQLGCMTEGSQEMVTFEMSKPKKRGKNKLIFDINGISPLGAEELAELEGKQLTNASLFIDSASDSTTDDTPIGIWYGTDEVKDPKILSGVNKIFLFEPQIDVDPTITIPEPVQTYVSNNPGTKVYVTIGDGKRGPTKAGLQGLIAKENPLPNGIDGLVIEMENLGTGAGTHGWNEKNPVAVELTKLINHLQANGKEAIVTTANAGLTSELGCAIPGASPTCDPNIPLTKQGASGEADLINLEEFLGNSLISPGYNIGGASGSAEWDLWSPQIYDQYMVTKWSNWEKDGFNIWKDFPTEKIAFSTGLKEGTDTIESMQQTLKTWLTAEEAYGDPWKPTLLETLPVIGFPNTL